jgi:putative spermidine/putrescine transport system permease protein
LEACALTAATGSIRRSFFLTEGIRLGGRVLALIGAITVILPLMLTLYLSLFDETLIVFPPRGYTLGWYGQILDRFGAPLWVSTKIALASVAFALLLGVPAGIGLSRFQFRGRGLLSMLLLSPLAVPGVALGLGLYVFAVWVEESAGLALSGSLSLLVAAHVLITLPWVVRLCLAGLVGHDAATEEAAASLGARPLMVIWRVTMPAMRSGIVAGALFAFIVSFENLEMTIFLVSPGMNTLPNAVLNYLIYHIDPLVAAVAVVQMVLIGTALVTLDRFVRVTRVLR